MCDAIRAWVNSAEGEDINLLLEAPQIRVDASRDGSELRGVIPSSAPTDVRADVRPVVSKNGFPFRIKKDRASSLRRIW